jgi:hypothetical protein
MQIDIQAAQRASLSASDRNPDDARRHVISQKSMLPLACNPGELIVTDTHPIDNAVARNANAGV